MSGPDAPASVAIIDDHLLFATALADLVRALPDFRVAGVAGTGRDAVATVTEHRPDLILLDFHLPGVLATDILPELRQVSPKSRIIILTSDTSLATREAADAAGVDGFLTKEQALDDVADALRGALGPRTAPDAWPDGDDGLPAGAAPDAPPATDDGIPAGVAPRVPAADATAEPMPASETAAEAAPQAPEAKPASEPGSEPKPLAAAAPAAPAPVVRAPAEAPAPPRAAPAPLRTSGVAELRRRTPFQPIPAGRGTLVGIYGAKGGVGTTTVATNLGVTLARGGAPTVLVDLDLAFGDVGMFLDLEGGPSISDAAQGRIDTDMLSRTALRHSSGLRVLASPATPSPVRPEPADILAILEELRTRFTYVLCDIPRVLGPLTIGALRAVDTVVLVTTPELPALRDLERVLARQSLGLRARGVLVVNRHPGRTGVALKDVELGLGLPVRATIPSDGVAVTDAINRGIPAAAAGTRLGRSFRELADRLGSVASARSDA